MTVAEIQNYFNPVIGYEHIKKELVMLCHMLTTPEEYSKIGAKLRQNIMLVGPPGVGKSLLSKCFVEATGRKYYRCSKNRSDSDFVDVIYNTFVEAKEHQPSIILLDDMDKFANSDDEYKDCDAYVTVQSCIDEFQDEDIVVIATCNDSSRLPNSLIRPGRFDKKIFVSRPSGPDAELIATHYLDTKLSSIQMDRKLVSRLLCGFSCAEIESVINEAAIYACFNQRAELSEQDIIKAVMRVIYECADVENEMRSASDIELAAIHEAGHAVMAEVLCPGSVVFISIQKQKLDSTMGGFTHVDTTMFPKPETGLENLRQKCIVDLGGLCAVETLTNEPDAGASSDLANVCSNVGRFALDSGMFDFVESICSSGYYATSDVAKTLNMQNTQKMMIKFRKETFKLVKKNLERIKAVASALAENDNLSYKQFQEIIYGKSQQLIMDSMQRTPCNYRCVLKDKKSKRGK